MFCKGFTRTHLEDFFGVRFSEDGVTVPYLTVNGELHREKLFSAEGKPLCWLGDAKPQIPYGLETLSYGGECAFMTEGESCSWAVRTCFPRTPVIGLPGASSWRPEWARLLKRFPVIYMSFDADEAGTGLLDTVWPTLAWGRRLKLPEGSDTRDLIQLGGGVEKYERLLDDADYIAGATRFLLEAASLKELNHAV